MKQRQASGSAPPELDAELSYKIGAAAFDAWASAPASTRGPLAEEAREAFEKYLAESPEGASAMEANMGLARLAIDRGDRALAAANLKSASEETRNSKLLEGRNAYSEAKPYLDAALKLAKAKVESLRATEGTRFEALQLAQGFFLDARIRLATLQAQTARTFAPNSAEYQSGLNAARKDFGEIAESFGQFAGSFKARYLEAECLRDLGDNDGAETILGELAVLPFEEQFYLIKTQSLLLFAEIADEKNDPELNMSLAKKFYDWKEEEKLPVEFYASAEGQRIALLAGRAVIRLEKTRLTDFNAFARAGKRTFIDETDPLYKTMNVPERRATKGNTIVVYALKILSEVAAGRGAIALEAQALLKDEIFDGIDASQYSFAKKIDSFQAAVDAATRSAAAFSQANQEYANASASSLNEAKDARSAAGRDAIEAFQNAFDWSARAVRPDRRGRLRSEDLTAAQTELDKLYMQYSLVCFALERYEDSFAAGSYLARRRPDSPESSQAAIVALRSLQAILIKMRADDASAAAIAGVQARIDAFSNYIVERWDGGGSSDSAVALEVAVIRLDGAVANGDVELARVLLEEIPTTSTRRANAELRLGQALWNEYVERSAEWVALSRDDDVEEQELDAKKAKLTELLDMASQVLHDGLQRMLASPAGVTENDSLAIFGTFLLAQVYERQGEFAETEKWLAHPVIGAQTVVDRAMKAEAENDLDANIPEFVNESFQMSVYALVLSVATSSPEKFAGAEATMTTLEELAGKSKDANGKLTGVYIRLGRRLEDRMAQLKEEAESADDEGERAAKEAELDAAVRGFEAFLKRVSERDAGNTYASLRWVADSYLALGRGLTGVSSDPPREALAYFSIAGKTYQTILKKIAEDPAFAPTPQTKLAVDVKIVECLRSAGQYQKAFEELKKTIKDNRDNLDVQIEAAQIFQDWGRKDPKYYTVAIIGAAPDAKGINYVWGWNGIARRVVGLIDRGERFKEVFYDAYLSKTRARYLYMRKLRDKDERAQQARDAESDLERLCQTHPDLGGPENFAKFDSAYKNFQKFRGEKQPKSLRDVVNMDPAGE